MAGSLVVVVVVLDPDRVDRGEFSLLTDREDAARYIEHLVESGTDHERIRVLAGGELQVQLSYRPVINLADEEQPSEDEMAEPAAEHAGEGQPQ